MLQETKCPRRQTQKIIQQNWRQAKVVTTDAQGYFGGIALAWNQESIQMDTYWTTRKTITTKFHYRRTNIQGFITSVYSPNAPQEKQAFLEELHHTSSLVGVAYWIIGGDFNMITSLTEKKR